MLLLRRVTQLDEDGEVILVTVFSPILKRECSMKMFTSKYEIALGMNKYNEGAMVQDAFPFLNIDEREFLMTGLDKENWERYWDENFFTRS